jgi:hypothetical protein
VKKTEENANEDSRTSLSVMGWETKLKAEITRDNCWQKIKPADKFVWKILEFIKFRLKLHRSTFAKLFFAFHANVIISVSRITNQTKREITSRASSSLSLLYQSFVAVVTMCKQ